MDGEDNINEGFPTCDCKFVFRSLRKVGNPALSVFLFFPKNAYTRAQTHALSTGSAVAYEGEFCAQPLSPAILCSELNPCQHGGRCIDGIDNVNGGLNSCEDCDEGYSGAICELDLDPCPATPAATGSTPSAEESTTGTGIVVTCDTGYSTTDTATCNADNSWELPTCVDNPSPATAAAYGTTPSAVQSDTGSGIEVECISGYATTGTAT